MTNHVAFPTDYHQLYYRQAQRARRAIEMAGLQKARADARREYHATKAAVLYRYPIGPRRPDPQVVQIYESPIGPSMPSPARDVLFLTTIRHPIARIQHEVSEKLGIPLADILSARRKAPVVFARQFAIWRAWKETSSSYPQLGERFGGRDHTTCMWAVKKMERLFKSGELAARGLV